MGEIKKGQCVLYELFLNRKEIWIGLVSLSFKSEKESIQSSLPHGEAPTLQPLLPLLALMYWARPSFLLCYEESPAGFALVCESYLLPSQRVMNQTQCLNVKNLRLPHPSRLSAFFTTFPGLYLWKKPYRQTWKCWLWLSVLVSASLIHLVCFEDRTVADVCILPFFFHSIRCDGWRLILTELCLSSYQTLPGFPESL